MHTAGSTSEKKGADEMCDSDCKPDKTFLEEQTFTKSLSECPHARFITVRKIWINQTIVIYY